MTLQAGEVSVVEVALTIVPFCIRPFLVDVVAPDAPFGMVTNETGPVLNTCGGDISRFFIEFVGDGFLHWFELQFVDAEFGGVLAVIPVHIEPADAGGAHVLNLAPGELVEGIDFGNRRLRPPPNQIPGDCNQNGVCDFGDVVCLFWVLIFHGEVGPCLDDAGSLLLLDFDGNQRLDFRDLIGKVRFLFHGRPVHVLGTECVPIPGCDTTCR